MLTVACDSRPKDADLDRLRREANAENERRLAARPGSSDETWSLVVEGQTRRGRATVFLPELLALATAHVMAPWDRETPDVDVDYRVVPAATLVERVGVASGVSDITFVAADGHRSVVKLVDAQRYPIGLAVEGDGKRLTRETGGPLFLVFPARAYPELRSYGGTSWVFYVTHMILGTEPAKLHVAESDLDAAALDRLPQQTATVTSRNGVGWPTDPVSLQGPSVTEVWASAHGSLGADDELVVDAKPLVWREAGRQPRFSADDLRQCAPLLATHWGDHGAPIPASMGGPVILAFPTDCPQHHDDQRWPTFVQGLALRKRAR
jgi:hypothetical protein